MTLITSDASKVKILQEELEESSSTIKLLNDKVNRLVEQLDNQGCSINHAMGLDFTVENTLANVCLVKLSEISTLLHNKGIFPDIVKEIENIQKQRETKE